ncbi:MAG: hypothetical protein B7C24_17745 [Bacteroidetes bacterium 4572_77]|nr:MAG: hypothetical protein B7C24_17745 [Bacteroidetes bacterium 4572_77]
MFNRTTKIAALTLVAFLIIMTGCKKIEKPVVEEEEVVVKSFDPANMDTVNYKPGDDFYRYVNGTWLDNNPVPSTETRWSTFNELAEDNRLAIKAIFAEIINDESLEQGSEAQKIRDFYNTGMDSVERNKVGIAPLLEDLKAVDEITDLASMQQYLNNQYLSGHQYIYAMAVSSDPNNSDMNIMHLFQNGTLLPNRDYYLQDNEQFQKIRDAYQAHIVEMFQHIGSDEVTATAVSETIMKMETRIAEFQWSIEKMRNSDLTTNRYKQEDLKSLASNIDWESIWAAIGQEPGELNCYPPSFYENLDVMLGDTPIEDWKVYLKWHYMNDVISSLDDATYDMSFAFWGGVLSGQKEPKPRWKRIQGATSGALGDAIGQLYVSKHFPPEAKEKMLGLVEDLRVAFAQHIKKVTWMSDPTKVKALEKLQTITCMIGYPDDGEWKDYSSLEISADSYYSNRKAVSKWSHDYSLKDLNKQVNKKEWHMTPQTVNAYYSPNTNQIVFPAGILQPPYFNLYADDALNYGAIGVVIAHEMTHGFDDQGRKYDKKGNKADWWTEEDAARFDEQAKSLVDQFGSYVMLDSIHIKGEMTLGENIADYGGLSISITALKNRIGEDKVNSPEEKIDGFTPLQRFFISYAQAWRNNITDEALRNNLTMDVHTPGEYRTNGGVVNIPDFYKAFNVTEEDALYLAPEKRALIW